MTLSMLHGLLSLLALGVAMWRAALLVAAAHARALSLAMVITTRRTLRIHGLLPLPLPLTRNRSRNRGWEIGIVREHQHQHQHRRGFQSSQQPIGQQTTLYKPIRASMGLMLSSFGRQAAPATPNACSSACAPFPSGATLVEPVPFF